MALAWTRSPQVPTPPPGSAPRSILGGSQVLALAGADAEKRRSILTTSVGRLFDAVCCPGRTAITKVTYEGQAAIELEMLARSVPRSSAPRYPVDIVTAASPDDLDVLDPSPLIATVLDEVERGTDRSVIAAGFHEGLGRATAALGARLARRHDLDTVALSGGCSRTCASATSSRTLSPPRDSPFSCTSRCHK